MKSTNWRRERVEEKKPTTSAIALTQQHIDRRIRLTAFFTIAAFLVFSQTEEQQSFFFPTIQ